MLDSALRSSRPAGLGAALFLFVTICTTGWAQPPRLASDSISSENLQQYSELAVRWMQQYLQIDTTNPPGHEAKAAAFFKRILDAEGIENRVFDYAPGRANIWARVKGSGRKRPIILLNHMDVVTSDASHWTVPPFSGAIVNGSMYGRGAQDMKCDAIAQLLTLVVLKREGVQLDRDVIFLATADEEVDDTGTDWMIGNQRALFGDAEYLITEGGENPLETDGVAYIGVDAAEKAPFWLRVTAHGQAGHGSRPQDDSAPNRLVHALDRIIGYQGETKVLPVVEDFLREMAAFEPAARARQFRDVRAAMQDESFRESVERDPSVSYLFRNTIALTMLGGSQQTNVLPSEAWANLDVRLLPGEDPEEFLAEMRRVVGDSAVSIEPLNANFSPANASPTNTDLFAAIRRVASRYFPGAPVVPRLTSGYTENQRFRQLGIVSYGFTPYVTTAEEGSTEHGDNERIRVEELRRGYRVLVDVVAEIAGQNDLRVAGGNKAGR